MKEDKDLKIKNEGQKPTMETQGPPPPPTSSQYFLHPHPPYMSTAAPYPFDYRNVLMSSSYNPPPYHLPMPRFHAPEDLSRNATPKALDVLQHHAAYYSNHKIHELSERALKSPTSGGVKVSVSSPNISQQPGGPPQGPPSQGGPGQMPGGGPPPSSGPLNLQPGGVMGGQKGGPDGKPQNEKGAGVGPGSGGGPPGSNPADSRSPPPQRHVHTHHHTHVGLGYPMSTMFNAPYGGR